MNNTVNAFETIMGSGAGPPSWGGMVIYTCIFILLPLMFLGMGIAILWSIASYTRFKKYLDGFINSFQYALTGLITCVTLAIPMALVYWGFLQAKAGNTVPLRYGVYIILGYIVLATIGWLVHKYVIERVSKFEEELKVDEPKSDEVVDELKSDEEVNEIKGDEELNEKEQS